MVYLGMYLSIITCCLISWYGCFSCGKVVDDRHHKIPRGQLKQVLINVKQHKNPWKFIRDLQDAFGNFGTFKDVKKDHVVSVVIHITVSCLIFFTFGQTLAMFYAAVLFACNPCANQVSAWCNGKRYGVNTIFTLLSYAFFPALFILYPLGLFSQINMLLLPLLYLYDGIFIHLLLVPILAIPAYRFLHRWYNNRIKKVPKNSEFLTIAPRKLILMAKTYNYYFWHSIMPIQCTIFPSYNHYFSIGEGFTKGVYKMNREFWFSVLTITCVSITIIALHGSMISFGLFWFSLFISIWLGLLLVSMPIADRYLYLPLVGQMVFLGTLFTYLPSIVFPIIIIIYILKAWKTIEQYRDLESMVYFHLYNQPDSPICYMTIINNLIKQKNFHGAFYWAERMVNKFPDDGYAHYIYGNACATFDKIDLAIFHLNMALAKMDKHKLENFEANIHQGLSFLKAESERLECVKMMEERK